jgi:transposase
MTIAPLYIGIDISKKWLDIFDPSLGQVSRILNTPEAIRLRIDEWQDTDVFIVFEATGAYDTTLGESLAAAGLAHARCNPARVRDFARASGRLAKTDAIDARMLSAFGTALRPPPEPPAPEARKHLYQLGKRRDQLVAMRVQEKNRLSITANAGISAHIRRHIDYLNAEIAAIEHETAAFIASTPELCAEEKRLRSVPGIGPVCAVQILSGLPEAGRISHKEIAALAGLAPMNHDSGSLRGQRTITGGRKRVRDALYIAALNAVRRKGPLKDFYTRLKDKGKPTKVALIATARKILSIINAIMKNQTKYTAT